MNEINKANDIPDVEAIINEIRKDLKKAGAAISEDELKETKEVRDDEDLYTNVIAANRSWNAGHLPQQGMKFKIRKALRRLLGIDDFNGNIIRILNELIKILEGQDTVMSGELLFRNRLRIDLLTQLSHRLSQYDDMNIEQRLRRLEKPMEQE
ncbi:MAG: hypothetical protein ABIK27_03360 [Bacteroidota bacterium]